MRIATKWLYDQGMDTMQRQQAQLVRTQQQLSTGRRFQTPADDPIAAAEALRMQQALRSGEQFARNQDYASNRLRMEESVLGNITELYAQARSVLLQAGNASYTDQDRAAMAISLRSQFEQLLALANSTDGGGSYLFSGNRETVAPFAATTTGAVYNGDQGQRVLQVSVSRELEVGDSGAELFERIRSGNGVFMTSASAANTGMGVLGPGSVIDPAALTGHAYRIVFAAGGSGMTYDVVDTTTAATISSGNPYVSGSAISFAGMRMSLEGSPASGDRFDVLPSVSRSVFTTLADAITLLQGGAATSAARARFSMGIAEALSSLDQASFQASNTRAAVGNRLAELGSLSAANADLRSIHAEHLSKLQDVDYAVAASDLVLTQTALTAAQKSYAQITRLTLFDFL